MPVTTAAHASLCGVTCGIYTDRSVRATIMCDSPNSIEGMLCRIPVERSLELARVKNTIVCRLRTETLAGMSVALPESCHSVSLLVSR